MEKNMLVRGNAPLVTFTVTAVAHKRMDRAELSQIKAALEYGMQYAASLLIRSGVTHEELTLEVKVQ